MVEREMSSVLAAACCNSVAAVCNKTTMPVLAGGLMGLCLVWLGMTLVTRWFYAKNHGMGMAPQPRHPNAENMRQMRATGLELQRRQADG
jgi:hypothetical protein